MKLDTKMNLEFQNFKLIWGHAKIDVRTFPGRILVFFPNGLLVYSLQNSENFSNVRALHIF